MTGELNGVLGPTTKYLPTDEDGAFDEASYRNLINWLIANGVTAVGAFHGHIYEYSDATRKQVAEITVDEVDGRVPVVFGVASWDLETAIKRAKDVEHLDIDILYVVGPPMERPYSENVEDITEYVGTFNDEVDLPIMYCNSPAFWPQELKPDQLLEIIDAAPQVEYIMNCNKRTHVHRETVEGLQGSGVDVLAGKSYNLYHTLASTADLDEPMAGITGYMPGTLPAEHVAMFDAYANGDLDEMAQIYWEKILPVINIYYGSGSVAQSNPPPDSVAEDLFSGFMYMLKEMGVIETARHPFSVKTVGDYTKQEIDRYFRHVNPSPAGR